MSPNKRTEKFQLYGDLIFSWIMLIGLESGGKKRRVTARQKICFDIKLVFRYNLQVISKNSITHELQVTTALKVYSQSSHSCLLGTSSLFELIVFFYGARRKRKQKTSSFTVDLYTVK